MSKKLIIFLTVISLIAAIIPSIAFAGVIYTGTETNASGKEGVDLPEDPIDDEGELIGDLNGDDQISSDDAILLLMHTQFPEVKEYAISQPADYTRDGQVSSDDAIHLLMHTQFPEVEEYKLNPLPNPEQETSSADESSSQQETSSAEESSSTKETSSSQETGEEIPQGEGGLDEEELQSINQNSITLPTVRV